MSNSKSVHDHCLDNGIDHAELAKKSGLEEQRTLAILMGRWTPSPMRSSGVTKRPSNTSTGRALGSELTRAGRNRRFTASDHGGERPIVRSATAMTRKSLLNHRGAQFVSLLASSLYAMNRRKVFLQF